MLTVAHRPSSDPGLLELIARHRAFCAAHTPAGSGHAVDPDLPAVQEVRYWVASDGDRPLGCVGLRALAADHGEIKTLHVLAEARGRGIGALLMDALMAAARSEGLTRLSLETGRSEGFAPSRAFYIGLGFEPCEAFGEYASDPFSVCMTREL